MPVKFKSNTTIFSTGKTTIREYNVPPISATEIIELSPTVCDYQTPGTSNCQASGVYLVAHTSGTGKAVTYLWTVDAGYSLTNETTDTVTVTEDVAGTAGTGTFNLTCDVTENASTSIASDTMTWTRTAIQPVILITAINEITPASCTIDNTGQGETVCNTMNGVNGQYQVAIDGATGDPATQTIIWGPPTVGTIVAGQDTDTVTIALPDGATSSTFDIGVRVVDSTGDITIPSVTFTITRTVI